MVLRVFILLTALVALTGCSNKPNYAKASINPWNEKLYSNHHGAIPRAIKFCQTYQLAEPLPLTLRFDCLLSNDEITVYKRAFERYHHFIINKFNASLVSDNIKLDKPLCFSVVHRETRFRIGEPVADCIHLYRPALPAERFDTVKTNLLSAGIKWEPEPALITPTESEEHFAAVFALEVLYLDIVTDFYPTMLHEYFHYHSLPLSQLRPWRAKPVGPFYDIWVNEYLASTLDNLLYQIPFKTFHYHIYGPISEQFSLGQFNYSHDDEQFILQLCQSQPSEADWHRHWSASTSLTKSTIKSGTGSLLHYLHSLAQGQHLEALYAYYEFTSLAEPGMGLADLIARIPACNPGKTLPVHAFKHQLLDYNFATLLTNEPTDNADAATEYGRLLRTAWQQQTAAKQPKLVRDANAMQHSQTVPYVYQDGFVIFQQQDHQVRLNLCLDTGSPLSYITRRYRERYQLTPAYLASKLEPEAEVGEQPRRVALPILGEKRKVRVLPHDGFMQCDIIVGTDLLGIFTAIDIHQQTLTLWN